MEWQDEGIILGLRPLGEKTLVASILTKEHGRCIGLCPRCFIDIGAHVQVTWGTEGGGEGKGRWRFEDIALSPIQGLEPLKTLQVLCQLYHSVLPEKMPSLCLYHLFQKSCVQLSLPLSVFSLPQMYGLCEAHLLHECGALSEKSAHFLEKNEGMGVKEILSYLENMHVFFRAHWPFLKQFLHNRMDLIQHFLRIL